jgi:hypothetical protein
MGNDRTVQWTCKLNIVGAIARKCMSIGFDDSAVADQERTRHLESAADNASESESKDGSFDQCSPKGARPKQLRECPQSKFQSLIDAASRITDLIELLAPILLQHLLALVKRSHVDDDRTDAGRLNLGLLSRQVIQGFATIGTPGMSHANNKQLLSLRQFVHRFAGLSPCLLQRLH